MSTRTLMGCPGSQTVRDGASQLKRTCLAFQCAFMPCCCACVHVSCMHLYWQSRLVSAKQNADVP